MKNVCLGCDVVSNTQEAPEKNVYSVLSSVEPIFSDDQY